MLFWHRWWSLSAKLLFFLNGRIMWYMVTKQTERNESIYYMYTQWMVEIRIYHEEPYLKWFSTVVRLDFGGNFFLSFTNREREREKEWVRQTSTAFLSYHFTHWYILTHNVHIHISSIKDNSIQSHYLSSLSSLCVKQHTGIMGYVLFGLHM